MSNKLGSGATAPEPNRFIEPENKNDKKEAKNGLDFSIWEKKYGRVLTETEKVEIRENSISLLKILLSEHRKELKSHG